MFVEFFKREYRNGGYISSKVLFAVDDISRVASCVDDYTCTNIITKDGKIHTVLEKYEDVAKKFVRRNRYYVRVENK